MRLRVMPSCCEYNKLYNLFFFFFSSRRRHTRFDCDWSSDVCSSDLTYQWTQISGPTVALASPTASKTTFTAVAGQSYVFKLTVTDSLGLTGTATTQIGRASCRERV